jgi:hypothetical protein
MNFLFTSFTPSSGTDPNILLHKDHLLFETPSRMSTIGTSKTLTFARIIVVEIVKALLVSFESIMVHYIKIGKI